jgi:hypothetical protein
MKLTKTGLPKLWLVISTLYGDVSGRLNWLLFRSQTSATRMWFALCSIGFSSFMFFSGSAYHSEDEYVLMIQMAPDWMWSLAFLTHGLSLLYGVIFRVYNNFLLTLEGVLGVLIWSATSIAMSLAQGAIGATTAGALIAAWICVRYPCKVETTS